MHKMLILKNIQEIKWLIHCLFLGADWKMYKQIYLLQIKRINLNYKKMKVRINKTWMIINNN